MICSKSSWAVPDDAAALAERLGLIVAGLAALVARRFLKEPRFFALILPLWGWLGRVRRRFAAAMARPPGVRAARAVLPAVPGVARLRGTQVVGVRLPSGRGWLVRALGWEAAGYGCQLEALLAEPGMQLALAGLPAVGRILRPLCRMLGVVTAADRVAAEVSAARRQARALAARAARARAREVRVQETRVSGGWTRPDARRWTGAVRVWRRKWPEARVERPPRGIPE